MARTVSDIALMLDAGVGHDPVDPLYFDPVSCFVGALDPAAPTVRIAFSRDLSIVPMAREIGDIAARAVHSLGAAGVDVTENIADFTGALDAFQTLRAVLLGTMMGDMLQTHRDQINADIIGNVERGFAVTPDQLFAAERLRWHYGTQYPRPFFYPLVGPASGSWRPPATTVARP